MNSFSGHPVVCFGESLWDILPTGAVPGGAPMNVAFHLKQLGNDPALITTTGADEYGAGLSDLLLREGICTDYCSTDHHHSTGIVYATANDRNEVEYDIVYPAAWDFIPFTEDLATLVSRSSYFVFGSLASRNDVSASTLRKLLSVANTKVLDINLRSPHFRQNEIGYLLSNANILKMNEAELALVTGWFAPFISIEKSICLLQEKFDIDTVIVTMGGKGAVVRHTGTMFRHPGYAIEVADTIGSGDAFLAGFLNQMLNGVSVAEALDFASALGALIATKTGACPKYDPSEITSLINSHHSNFETI